MTSPAVKVEPAWFPRTGCFVVFEGGDGMGKSTQSGLLCQWLSDNRRSYLQTFEPGDSVAGRQIRSIVLDPATGDLAPKAEALLYAADKAHHVQQIIEPALERGDVVVSDRYVDSMLAYQGAGRVLDVAAVESVARWATGNLRPNLTVVLDGDPTELTAGLPDKDRMESAGDVFHTAAREHLLALADRDPQHYLVLNARDAPDTIAASVRERVAGLLAG